LKPRLAFPEGEARLPAPPLDAAGGVTHQVVISAAAQPEDCVKARAGVRIRSAANAVNPRYLIAEVRFEFPGACVHVKDDHGGAGVPRGEGAGAAAPGDVLIAVAALLAVRDDRFEAAEEDGEVGCGPG